MGSRNIEKRFKKDGELNEKYVDLLDEDRAIAGQKFVCISFISPENIIKEKNHYFFEEFLKQWDINKSMEKFTQFLNFVSFKYHIHYDDVFEDFKEFLKEEKENIITSTVEGDYKTFIDKHEEDLEKKFNIEHNFQTSTRGIKIRGVFPTQEEAELRCKLLREADPYHDILVGPVGMWMPWDPEAYKTGRVEYLEEELNELMKEKNKNETFAKNVFEQRLKETKQKAMEENMKKAEKTGNPLTQTIDKDGNLIGINKFNTQENVIQNSLSGDSNVISSSDISRELFEGDNIILGKTDNGISQLKNNPFGQKSDE
jgi:hypothetical protein